MRLVFFSVFIAPNKNKLVKSRYRLARSKNIGAKRPEWLALNSVKLVFFSVFLTPNKEKLAKSQDRLARSKNIGAKSQTSPSSELEHLSNEQEKAGILQEHFSKNPG